MGQRIGEQFEDKEEYVRGVFRSIAPVYDTMNSIMTLGLVKKWRAFMHQQALPLPGKRILDVGTGTGESPFVLAEKIAPGGTVTGLDLSGDMLLVARKKLEEFMARNKEDVKIQFIEGDALALPFPGESFDSVITGFTLRNVTDIPLAVQEMTRVCKKGGRVVCLEISEPVQPLIRAGFKLYFYHLIPCLGRLADRGQRIRGRSPAYTWLSQSLRKFPQGREMAAVFEAAGLKEVKCYPLTLGVVTVYTGTKQENS